MIIHLNGAGGVGKLTVAKALAAKIDAGIIDNHVIIDLVTTLHKRRVLGYFAMIKKVLHLLFEELSAIPKEKPYIFTNWLSPDNPDDRYRMDSVAIFAEKRGVPFIQVLLECDLEENKKRVISEDRKGKGKLMDADILEDLYLNSEVYHPEATHRLTIDTTNKSPDETADEIISYINTITP